MIRWGKGRRSDGAGKSAALPGFDSRWRDFPDYILGITEEVWEGRGVGAALKSYYGRDIIVRMPGGVSEGEPAATRATLGVLQEFPDRQLLGEDVIWCGTPQAGLLSSHRILSTATAPDGSGGRRRVVWRALADCYAKDNQITDEWLIRDTGGLLRQLGTTPEAAARAALEAAAPPAPLTPETDREGPYTGRGNDHEAGARLEALLTEMMAGGFAVIPQAYDRACHLAYPGAVTGHGPADAQAFWLPLRAAFPDAEFTVHHVIGREDAQMPPRAAVRWSLWGRHAEWGAFGAPTGAMVYVLGITHAEFGPHGLRREWTLYDETAIWTQIAMGTPA